MTADAHIGAASGVRRGGRLEVAWFPAWEPALDDALQALPPLPQCPPDLYRELCVRPAAGGRRVALVTHRGAPVAVAGLRRTGPRSWEPVTGWIVPGLVVPARPEHLMPALEALGLDLWLGWWRMAAPPPLGAGARHRESYSAHRAHLSDDYEQHWRRSKLMRSVQNVRNRCRGLRVAINEPGAAEWVVRGWGDRWSVAEDALADRMLVTAHLQRLGRHFTLSLHDGETIVGGLTQTVHGNDLVAGVVHRDPAYERYGIGTRLIDAVFAFAREAGFDTLDIGGGHDYKARWAPPEGETWLVNVCPARLHHARQVRRAVCAVPRRLSAARRRHERGARSGSA